MTAKPKYEAKRYWLKLSNGFLNSKYIKIIKNMENGSDYVLFYLALMLESVETIGHLRLSELVAYDEKMLATLTDTNVDIVRSALRVFQSLGMIQVLEDKTIFIPEVPALTGKESDSAERVRRYRERQKELLLEGGNDEALQCNNEALQSNTIKNRIELEYNKEQNIIKKEEDCVELSDEISPPPSPIFISLPKIGSPSSPSKTYHVTEEYIAKLEATYPAVDVRQQLRHMAHWLEVNPAKKKVNVASFIARWLSKEQDKSRGVQSPPPKKTAMERALEITGEQV